MDTTFAYYVIVSGFICFVLAYWYIPTQLSKRNNFIGSLYLLAFGWLLWPVVLSASLRTLHNNYLKKKERGRVR